MRITNNMLINNMMSSLTNNLSRTAKYQDQLATGKKISKPSDDPIVASKSLKLRTDVAEIAQYSRNTEDATSWMEVTESTIGQLGEVMHRVRELSVQAANGTNTPSDLQRVRSEVEQLKKQATHLANATYAGRYVFSGFKTDKPLMDEEGNFLESIPISDEVLFEIGIGDSVNINVTGGDLFNRASGTDTAGTAMSSKPLTFPLAISAGVNDTLNMDIDGEPIVVTLPAGTFSSSANFVTTLENTINAATSIAADVKVSLDGGKLLITSGSSGVASHVDMNGGNAAATLEMLTPVQVSGVSGSDTAGKAMGNTAMSFLPAGVTITTGVNDQLRVNVDGELVIATLAPGTYLTTDVAAFLTNVQNAVNAATATAQDITASFDTGRLVLTSGTKGLGSVVDVLSADPLSTAAGTLGLATTTEIPGADGVKGTMMKMFDDLLAGLDKGDHGALSKLIGDVDEEVSNMLRIRSGVGARMNRLELTSNRLSEDNIGFTKLMSLNEDVDIAEAIMHLKSEEAVYQASLSTGARVIQPTLVDYIK